MSRNTPLRFSSARSSRSSRAAFAKIAPLVALGLPAAIVAVAPRQSPSPGRSSASRTANSPASDAERAPSDLCLLDSGRRALVANRLSGTVSLVDLNAGVVLAEGKSGAEPFAVAASGDGKVAVCSNRGDGTVSVFSVTPTGLTKTRTIPVGDAPRGVAITQDGATAYVALAGDDKIAEVDLARGRVLRKLSAGDEPWRLALFGNDKKLVVGNTRSRDVRAIDLSTGKTIATNDLSGRNVRQLAISPDGETAFVPFTAERLAPTDRFNIDRGWVVGNRLARVSLTDSGPREAITLDFRGAGVADVDGCALAPDGKTIALTAAGTHELVLIQNPDTLRFVTFGGPGDHIDPDTRRRMRRIPLGGRPLGVTFLPGGKRIVVANDFLNAIQIVDVASEVVISIPLGGATSKSAMRQGEILFHDARRSFGSWYSCASCHVEGETGGGSFDTFNDGGYGKPKRAPSLRGVASTAPYTWHGWQTSLRSAIAESFTNSMQGRPATDSEVDSVEAYLKSLDFRQSPYSKTSPAAVRGKAVFAQKGCESCHAAPNYTAPIVMKVGLEEPGDIYSGFNPPSLRGVYARAPYLHDTSSPTLEDVLTRRHRPSKLTGKPDFTRTELTDCVAFLKSL